MQIKFFFSYLFIPMGWVFFLFFFIAHPLLALELPKNLNREDRLNVVRLLSMGSSTKILSNPFPLGGYQGLELGLSMELINVADISRLGDGTHKELREFRFPRISIGKGLYNDVDLFFHFVPFSEESTMSEYGGMGRWSFYQARFLPINLSLLLHASVLNINDSLSSQTIGTELVAGISVDQFSLYFGGGFLTCSAEFTAVGHEGLVTNSDPYGRRGTITELLRDSHNVVGITLHFWDLFIAAQIDRYREPVYSLKLGLRL